MPYLPPQGTAKVAGPAKRIETRTSDPDLEEGRVWYRSDLDRLKGAIWLKFAAPSSGSWGVGLDSNGCVWNSANPNKMYKLDQMGSVIDSFAAPSDTQRGLDLDSNDCIWYAERAQWKIYQLDQAGSIVTSFASPSTSPYGIALDPNDCIWHADESMNAILKMNQTGSIITSFPAPDGKFGPKPEGVGLDSAGCIWHGDWYGTLYKLDQTGSIITSFDLDADGISLDSDDSIWYQGDNEIRKIKRDTTHALEARTFKFI